MGLTRARYNATPDTLEDGQWTDLNVDENGNLKVVGGDTGGMAVIPPTSTTWNYAAPTGGIDNSSTAVTIKAAAGAGVRNYVRSIHIAHDTLGAATEIAIRDGAGGTVLWRGKLQTTANEGFTVQFADPLKGSANTLLEFLTITAVTGDVLFNAQGFTGE